MEILLLHQNFNFWSKFWLFHKSLSFGQDFDFSLKFRCLPRILNFHRIFMFLIKIILFYIFLVLTSNQKCTYLNQNFMYQSRDHNVSNQKFYLKIFQGPVPCLVFTKCFLVRKCAFKLPFFFIYWKFLTGILELFYKNFSIWPKPISIYG